MQDLSFECLISQPPPPPPPTPFVFISLILMNLFEDLPALLGDKRGLHQHGCSFSPLTSIYSPALLSLTSSLSSPVCPQSPLYTHPSLPLSLPPPCLSVLEVVMSGWAAGREEGTQWCNAGAADKSQQARERRGGEMRQRVGERG